MTLRRLEVSIDFGTENDAGAGARHVGTLAEDGAQLVFEYAASFIASPLPLSPYHLPVRSGLFRHDDRDFDRLPGLIADAMPDGFGRLIQDRAFELHGVDRAHVTPLDRLAALGAAAMGALTFHPAEPLADDESDLRDLWPLDLDAIAAQGPALLEGSHEDVLPQLLAAGGSPGGARPKILAGVHADGRVIAGVTSAHVLGHAVALPEGFEPWIIKFPAREDTAAYGSDAGAVEYAWWRMAREAGLVVPEARLFETAPGHRYFGIRRFDRHGPGGGRRRHVHSLSGLLHASHRLPSLDYKDYLQASADLTRDVREAREAVRRMMFNAVAHNRDDHARNFAFLMSDTGGWSLAPAYDLTLSAGIGGHHTTSFSGQSSAPHATVLLALATKVGVSEPAARETLDEVVHAVEQWPRIAKELQIRSSTTARLERVLKGVRTELWSLPAPSAKRRKAPAKDPRRSGG